MINKKILSIIIGVLMIAAISVGLVVSQGAATVAKVDGEKITKDELYALLMEQYGEQALDVLVQQKVIDLEAKKSNIIVTEAEINDEITEISKTYGGEEALNSALTYSGMTLEDFKSNLEYNIKITKILEPNISISEEEIKNYFETNKATFAVAEQVKASHILLETEEKAKEVKSLLSQGKDFGELAKEYSTDTNTKEQSGELGTFGKGEMASAFEEAVFNLKIGQISEPVKTEYGFHIIKLEDKIEAKEANLEESKQKIKEIILNEKVQAEFDTWIQKKYEEYKIEKKI